MHYKAFTCKAGVHRRAHFSLIYRLLALLTACIFSMSLWLMAGWQQKNPNARWGWACKRLSARQQASRGLAGLSCADAQIRCSLRARLMLPCPLIDWRVIEPKENLTLCLRAWHRLIMRLSVLASFMQCGCLSSMWKDSSSFYSILCSWRYYLSGYNCWMGGRLCLLFPWLEDNYL